MSSFSLFAVAAPGLEPIVADELRQLAGAMAVKQLPGGVAFTGDLAALFRANLWLRCATRVVVRLGEFKAENFDDLRLAASKLPWARFVTPGGALRFEVSAQKSRLYHTKAIAENLLAAIKAAGIDVNEAAEGERVMVRVANDKFVISIDSSGERLHVRGWRTEQLAAPLRETLAAGLLRLAKWEPAEPLCDPLCGAGTIPIEAALMAVNRAPGLGRAFACERWPIADSAQFGQLRQAAQKAARAELRASIYASDASERAIEIAAQNAARAGVAAITFSRGDFQTLAPPAAAGLVICNPPYGKRLDGSATLYSDIGVHLKQAFGAWRVAILLPNPAFERAFCKALGRRAEAEFTVDNGGIRLRFLSFPALC